MRPWPGVDRAGMLTRPRARSAAWAAALTVLPYRPRRDRQQSVLEIPVRGLTQLLPRDTCLRRCLIIILVLSRPDAVSAVHRAFLEVGVDVIETDAFGAFGVVLAEYGLENRVREINLAAARIARAAGARTALVTAQPNGALTKRVDIVTVIPAQTMADDRGPSLSVLPMGSLFETAQMIAFELAILKLRARFRETSETMRARHTNLE